MDRNSWVLVSIAVLIALLGVVAFLLKRGKGHKPDYKVLFIAGAAWIPIGIAIDNYLFSIAGAVMMIIGLANKGKWKSREKLSEKEKKIKLILILAATALLVVGLAVYFIY